MASSQFTKNNKPSRPFEFQGDALRFAPMANPPSKGSTPTSPYSHQFSKTTSLILNRMKAGAAGLDVALSGVSQSKSAHSKDAYEEAKARVVQSLNTSSISESLDPGRPTSAWAAINTSNTGVKRKREDVGDEEIIDYARSNTIPLPVPRARIDPDGRAKLQKRIEEGTPAPQFCDGCQMVVAQDPRPICTGCWKTWHPPCMSFLPKRDALDCFIVCLACGEKQKAEETAARARHVEQQRRQQKIDRIRTKRLAGLPDGIAPAKPELVGFSARGAVDAARVEYFDNMKKTDLLNVLSFCDQLHPGLLVDLMVSASKRHPDLPMFNSPDWESYITPTLPPPLPKPRAPIKPAHLTGKRHGHSLLNSKAKQRIKGSTRSIVKRPSKLSTMIGQEEVVPEEEEDEDALPPTWPKAGEGLYSKLVSEVEDRRRLVDENDEEAFSHFMVDKHGKQIIETV